MFNSFKKIFAAVLCLTLIAAVLGCTAAEDAQNIDKADEKQAEISLSEFDFEVMPNEKFSSYPAYPLFSQNQLAEYDGCAYFIGSFDGEYKLTRYDINSAKISPLETVSDFGLNRYENKLFLSGDDGCVSYDIAKGSSSTISGMENGTLIFDKMYTIVPSTDEQDCIGDIYCYDIKSQKSSLIADGVFTEFLSYDENSLYYCRKNGEAYDVYAQDLVSGEDKLIKTLDGAPLTAANGAIAYLKRGALHIEKSGDTQISDGKTQPLSVLINGDTVFYTADNGGLRLYAYDMSKKSTCDFGNIPDPLITIAGDHMYSFSDPATGNVSMVEIKNGKPTYRTIAMNHPYPYES